MAVSQVHRARICQCATDDRGHAASRDGCWQAALQHDAAAVLSFFKGFVLRYQFLLYQRVPGIAASGSFQLTHEQKVDEVEDGKLCGDERNVWSYASSSVKPFSTTRM